MNDYQNALNIIELLKNLGDFNFYLDEVMELSTEEVDGAIKLLEESLIKNSNQS
jgi:hypothetical protein